MCYATMERETAWAAYQAMHGENTDAHWHDGTFTSWSKVRDEAHPVPATAGMKIGVADSDLAPWDLFTTEVDASPVPPPPDDQSQDSSGSPF